MAEQIFYTKIDNEIYQCKIKSLIIDAQGLKMNWDRNRFYINLMDVEIASVGIKTYVRYGYKNEINPSLIFETMEHVLANKPIMVNHLGEYDLNYFWNSIATMKTCLPTSAEWVEVRSYGTSISTRTWKWDGLHAVQSRLKAPIIIPSKFSDKKYINNSYEELQYDVIAEEFITNGEKTWLTEQECKDANTIKVHAF